MPRPPLLCSIIPSSAARARWVTATIAVGTFLSQSAPAQTAAAAAPGAPLEEVVVTAEKRDSTVQKTPISMTAITGDQLAAEGISSVEAVAAETPGISMRSAGPGQTEYEMRGVPSSGGSSPTVGFYLDETPLTAPAAALNGKVTIDPDLFDLNRIEVLRGPQGTLYGASSMGGTIKLVTNQPKLDKMEAAAQTTLSDTTGGGFNYGGSGMLNLPLVDHIAALRVVVTGKYNDGFIDYKVLSPFPIGPGGDCGFGSCVRGDVANAPVVKDTERANWERLQGERVSLLLQPTDALSLDVMAMHQDMRMGGFDQVDIPPGPDVALAHYQPFALAEPYYDKFTLYSATLNYSLDFAQLTSATAYWSRVSSFTGDNSEALQSQFAGFLGVTEMLPEAYSETDQSRQLTEELRLASTGSGPLKWLVGGYFANFSSTWEQYVANSALADISVGGAAANPLGVLYQANQPYGIKQYALFGESSYNLTDSLKATLGLRWYRYDTSLGYEQSGVISASGNATPFSGSVEGSDRGYNPKFNLAYAPNDDLTTYTTASRGFRPGGVNYPVPVSICGVQVPLTYGPDTLWNYELGEKARLFGGRVTVNTDVFYIRWDDVQQYLDLKCGFPYSVNAGNAVSYGPEAEVKAELAPGLVFEFGGAYSDAHITSVNPAVAGQTIGSTKVLTVGTVLQNVPRYTADAALNFVQPVSDNLQLSARVAASRIGPAFDIAYYYTKLPAYTLVNARLGLLGSTVSGYLFVDNIANEHAITAINNTQYSLSVPSFARGTVTQPRTVGINLSYKF